MAKKKSQGMSVNVIIIAALALIVLVVLTAIFTGRLKIFSESLQSCAAKQGHCSSECVDNEAVVIRTNCPEGDSDKTRNICCVPVFSGT
jgi:hypothetical protein